MYAGAIKSDVWLLVIFSFKKIQNLSFITYSKSAYKRQGDGGKANRDVFQFSY